MNLDLSPTAAATYTRTLISRGCPAQLAQSAGAALALPENSRGYREQALIEQAWASVQK